MQSSLSRLEAVQGVFAWKPALARSRVRAVVVLASGRNVGASKRRAMCGEEENMLPSREQQQPAPMTTNTRAGSRCMVCNRNIRAGARVREIKRAGKRVGYICIECVSHDDEQDMVL